VEIEWKLESFECELKAQRVEIFNWIHNVFCLLFTCEVYTSSFVRMLSVKFSWVVMKIWVNLTELSSRNICRLLNVEEISRCGKASKLWNLKHNLVFLVQTLIRMISQSVNWIKEIWIWDVLIVYIFKLCSNEVRWDACFKQR
jgi:hypothetical protein